MHIWHIALGGCLKGPPVAYGITSDTGGHIAYVLEAALSQAAFHQRHRVTIITRLFDDSKLGACYGRELEILNDRLAIYRLATCSRRYLEKDALANEQANFTQAFLEHLRVAQKLPNVIHAHFADAAAVAIAARDAFGIPFVYTPHALGLDKRGVMPDGSVSASRIATERRAIERANAIIVSSEDEVERQISAYRIADVGDRVHVVAPGLPTMDPAATSKAISIDTFEDPTKPLILAVARPMRKKNLIAVVEAFATSGLKDVANLALLAGQHAHISRGEARDVLQELGQGLGSLHLKGKVHFPAGHTSADVAALYRHAASLGGVFVNPALHEPFGLTLLEAAAAGLPVVATRNGGAADIVSAIGHGYLVDPEDHAAIAAACLRIVTDRHIHRNFSNAALRNRDRFSWSTYASRSLDIYGALVAAAQRKSPGTPRVVVCDIDGTLTGCRRAAARFARWAERSDLGFIVATGRHLVDAQAVLREWGIPSPDAFITEVGTRIHMQDYSGALREFTAFTASLDLDWDHDATASICDDLGLAIQPPECQNTHKLSFFGDASSAEDLRRLLTRAGLAANVVHSHGRFIDVLAPHAGKAAAVETYAGSRGLGLDDCVAAGDSGNDRDMLERCGAAIVVGNALPELLTLEPRNGLIRTHDHYAAGVLEGLAKLGIAGITPSVVRNLDEPVPA